MIGAPPESALVQSRPDASVGSAALALTVPPPWSVRKGGLRAQLHTLVRMLFVGFWSSGVDLLVLTLCVRWLHVQPTLSRFVALVVSGLLLFFGCRSFAFRATSGHLPRQARLFVAGEAMGFLLNLLVFRLLSGLVPSVAPELTSQLANSVVFIGFCYPLRRFLVFRTGAP